ncbi:hypothetical protein [Thalassotalea euphylliae]|uniref:Uncharacterized protein n=1 Tax=Thalassotalea euphylliae TaxID=1655234 RepID=A0A3E0U525_9GAMM|nr:hypothetical protein [Thalassotalea euphylliae]REL31072.1 hypothetical protein DXX94_10295 [Thalassotalea euphylliae]
MSKSSNNPILATLTCDCCGGTAYVKKRVNSKNYYIHCKKHGLEQRSGPLLQAKLAELVSGKSETVSEITESLSEATSDIEANLSEPAKHEWTPEVTQTIEVEEPSRDEPIQPDSNEPQSSGFGIKKTLGVLGFVGFTLATLKAAAKAATGN